ncbi:hypothetical protein GFS24_09445 [Chitinophaga sp. SYP-B3965]|uniref:hypothetical protein n=1 Tax=Chitinophaga sp. SYP-B3965 TaxID=2663120 RepID=UPI001299C0BB|nr:hypothetical protein [Chitinophaga sp. SYP-B3965]MRG45340.1 hypothetical protein [Chitinophaga sp. SYP-B3965]
MAKLVGDLKFRGTIGDITCCKTKDGFIVRKKREPKAITDDRTKENMREFARAISGASMIRNTFAAIIGDINDYYFGRRLNSQMIKVVKSDAVNLRGFRNISEGGIGLLHGFELNSDKSLCNAFKGQFLASIDRSSGLMKVDFPTLITASLISKPEGASHFRLCITGASIDFNTGNRLVEQKEGEYLPISNEGQIVSSLEVQLLPGSTASLILSLGICFYQEVNGKYHLLGNGHYNAAAFVAVSRS